MKDMIMRWISLNRGFRVGLQTIFAAASSYTGGLLTNYIASASTTGAGLYILIFGGFITVTLLTLLALLAERLSSSAYESQRREHNIHRSGYDSLSQELTALTQVIKDYSSAKQTSSHEYATSMMKRSVFDLYKTLELEYGQNESLERRIEFEVTFMTKSLVDHKITIAAWANRDGRAPKSLTMRALEPDIYTNTETDKLYQDPNMTARVIESTSTPELNYKELYPGQRTRIRSSIVYPVLDDESHLAGTVVIHCDRDGFFKPARMRFWRELLEPYTKRLALARTISDIARISEQADAPF